MQSCCRFGKSCKYVCTVSALSTPAFACEYACQRSCLRQTLGFAGGLPSPAAGPDAASPPGRFPTAGASAAARGRRAISQALPALPIPAAASHIHTLRPLVLLELHCAVVQQEARVPAVPQRGVDLGPSGRACSRHVVTSLVESLAHRFRVECTCKSGRDMPLCNVKGGQNLLCMQCRRQAQHPVASYSEINQTRLVALSASQTGTCTSSESQVNLAPGPEQPSRSRAKYSALTLRRGDLLAAACNC